MRTPLLWLLICLAVCCTSAGGKALADTTERVSVSSTGEQGDGPSGGGSISADGRYVAFGSAASNLVPAEANPEEDIFVHDRQTGETERVSVSSAGEQGNHVSLRPALSADGRYVAFMSYASNLVPGDANGTFDVFVHDRQTGETERVSVSSTGEPGDAQSFRPFANSDGRYVGFTSDATNLVPGDTNGTRDVFVHDRQTGETERVSVSTAGEQSNGLSQDVSLSADGRYVAFASRASNLVPGDTNDAYDIFVHDRQTGETERVSVSSAGEEANEFSTDPHISADGRCVVFSSPASNLVPGDTNGGHYQYDVFVHDRQTGQTERVSVSTAGEEANFGAMIPFVSGNGRYVGFTSDATNLVPEDTNRWCDVFVRDRAGFPDIPREHWAYDEIMACVSANIVQGYPDGTYQPLRAVTRDCMAVYVARALAGGDEAVPDPSGDTSSFTDVGADHWAYRYVEYVQQQHVVQGYADGSYQPDMVVDRGQMAVYIARAIVSPSGDAAVPNPPAGDPTFSDVTATGDWSWCYKHVEYLAASEIVQGYPDGTYHPATVVTRDQMAVYTQRALEVPM